MPMMNLSAPWIEHYRLIDAFFSEDPQVNVVYDDKDPTVKLYVSGDTRKAQALNEMFPPVVEFGGVSLSIEVIPSNDAPAKEAFTDKYDLLKHAFNGNRAVETIKPVDFFTDVWVYVICAREIVSIFNDDIGDFYGCYTTILEDIAREIFLPTAGVYYCTKVED